MTLITIAHPLPFVVVTVRANRQFLILERVLLDTGSAGTAFKTDVMERIGVGPSPEDSIVRMRGVGGTEVVVQKRIEAVEVEELIAAPMLIQVGMLEYHIPMDGIIGSDFLMQSGAMIDFKTMEVRKSN